MDKKAEYDITITEIVARLEHIHTTAMDLYTSRNLYHFPAQTRIETLYSKLDTLLYDIEEARIKEDEESE
jgi:hypothetical protein